MGPDAQRIHAHLDDAAALEVLYRRDPETFRIAFDEVARAVQDCATLRVWRARLDYRDAAAGSGYARLAQALGLALAVAVLVRVPAIWLGESWYYPRFGPLLVVMSVAAYFWLERRDRRELIAGSALAVVALVYTSLLPAGAGPDGPVYSDSVVMALIHLPVLLWAFVGYVFTGQAWRDAGARIRFVRYNGELLILASLVGLGFFVFSGLTVALFDLLAANSEEWYFSNVGLIGAAAVPVIASYLYDVVFKRHTGIASVLARIFAPLFLIMTSAYLVLAFVGGQNPFVDRSFLILCNGLLLVVLGMTVLSIAERGHGADVRWNDYINLALLAVTLAIDLIALAAIVFRLSSYGLTPNRVVVLGANLVVLAHLAWVGRRYFAFVRSGRGVGGIHHAVAAYLPVYPAWATLVVFVLPLMFRFT